MRIAVIGAGATGVGCAKVLTRVGHAVTVFDEGPDIGGTKNTADPEGTCTSFPLDHLRAYVEEFALHPNLRLNVAVSSAVRTTTGWRLTLRGVSDGRSWHQEFDHLIVATGVSPTPAIPLLPGAREFAAVGGETLSTADFHDLDQVRDRNVVVVGHGTSSCGVALEASDAARRTHLVVRGPLPHAARTSVALDAEDLMLTRVGEVLFDRHVQPGDRLLRAPADGLRRLLLNSRGVVPVRCGDLDDPDLAAHGAGVEVLRGRVGDTFAERVGSGRIEVHHDQVVERLVVHDGGPCAVLSGGSTLPADLLVHTTGPQQHLPYLDVDVVDQLLDGRGNLAVYRQVHPVGVPTLSFAVTTSPGTDPRDAELVAAWTAARLAGLVTAPDDHHLIDLTTVPSPAPEANPAGPHGRGDAVRPVFAGDLEEIRRDLTVVLGERRRADQQGPSSNAHLVLEVERRILAAGVVGVQ